MYARIKELCRENGTTVQKLEAAVGISNGAISKWDNKRPSADKLKAVADFFDVSMEFLLTGKEKQPVHVGGLSVETQEIAEIIESLPADRRHLLLLQARALRDELIARGTVAESP